MKNEHTIESFQVVEHHNDLTLFITVRHIDQIIQIMKKLQGTMLTFQYMNGLFLGVRMTQQSGHENSLGILHSLEVGIDEQRGGASMRPSPSAYRFLGVPLLLYDGLIVTLMVIYKDPIMTHGVFGVSTPMTLTFDKRVLGLAPETRFFCVWHSLLAK